MKWTHFPCYWSFVWEIHWPPVGFPHNGQWRGALILSVICAWTNGWSKTQDARNLRHNHAHYDVTVINFQSTFHCIYPHIYDPVFINIYYFHTYTGVESDELTTTEIIRGIYIYEVAGWCLLTPITCTTLGIIALFLITTVVPEVRHVYANARTGSIAVPCRVELWSLAWNHMRGCKHNFSSFFDSHL